MAPLELLGPQEYILRNGHRVGIDTGTNVVVLENVESGGIAIAFLERWITSKNWLRVGRYASYPQSCRPSVQKGRRLPRLTGARRKFIGPVLNLISSSCEYFCLLEVVVWVCHYYVRDFPEAGALDRRRKAMGED